MFFEWFFRKDPLQRIDTCKHDANFTPRRVVKRLIFCPFWGRLLGPGKAMGQATITAPSPVPHLSPPGSVRESAHSVMPSGPFHIEAIFLFDQADDDSWQAAKWGRPPSMHFLTIMNVEHI